MFNLQGRFEIISLSGSFLLSENNGNRSRIGGLSVSLAGADGRVLGGGVAGMLVAATPVQVLFSPIYLSMYNCFSVDAFLYINLEPCLILPGHRWQLHCRWQKA